MREVARDNRIVQALGEDGDDSITFVDRPKAGLRVVTLAVWGVSGFLLYKAVIGPSAESWFLWPALGIFTLCSCLVIREFKFRPTRVTAVCPWRRQIAVQETAPWRKRQVVASFPPGAHFEIFQCDSDNVQYFGVRIRSEANTWVTVADYLSRSNAESLAGDANSRLRG